MMKKRKKIAKELILTKISKNKDIKFLGISIMTFQKILIKKLEDQLVSF